MRDVIKRFFMTELCSHESGVTSGTILLVVLLRKLIKHSRSPLYANFDDCWDEHRAVSNEIHLS